RDCTVSPDGRLVVAVAGSTGEEGPSPRPSILTFWDTATGKEVFSGKSSSKGCIYKALFSHDGKRIAFVVEDGTVRVWDVARRRELFALTGKKGDGGLKAAAFSKDGKWLLTVAFFGKAQAWDASTGKLVKTAGTGIRVITSALFSPDGSKAVLTSNDG